MVCPAAIQTRPAAPNATQGTDLQRGEHAAHPGSLSDAEKVDDRQSSQEDRRDRRRTDRSSGRQPQLGDIRGQQVDLHSRREQPHEHRHPSHLQADESPERRVRVQIRTARLREAGRDLREGQHDQQGEERRDRVSGKHQPSEPRRDRARQRKDPASDDLIEDDGREAPTPDGPKDGRL